MPTITQKQPFRLRVDVAYAIARRIIERRQAGGRADQGEAVASWEAYAAWRYNGLRARFRQFFDESANGKDVLDFGCGDGALCFVLLESGAKTAHGIDMDEMVLARFAERLASHDGERKPTFACSTVPSRIDCPDQSFDAIYCLDVLEHIMDYKPIIGEWYRVLRAGGSVYIWWQPYWHPFGHHAYNWIPIPWVHVVLSDAEMTEVCARIVDWDCFDAPICDRNSDGTKKNRFRMPADGKGFLNRLTVHEFETCCAEVGFRLARREFIPFQQQPARTASRILTRIPRIRDYFMACAIYELQRPNGSAPGLSS